MEGGLCRLNNIIIISNFNCWVCYLVICGQAEYLFGFEIKNNNS